MSKRLDQFDHKRSHILLSLAPLLGQIGDIQETKSISDRLDLAATGHWHTLVQVTNMGLEIPTDIPVKNTLLLLSDRVETLEKAAAAVPASSSAPSTSKQKEKHKQSAWQQSTFRNFKVQQTVAHVPAQLQKAGKRGQVITELLESEVRFVNDLAILRDIYHASLLEQAKRTKPMVTEEEIESFFPGSFRAVCGVHEKFLNVLQTNINGWNSEKTCIGPLLSEMAFNALRPHSQYAIEFSHSSEVVQEWTAKKTTLANFLKDIRTHPQCASRDVMDFLIMPVQRILRYKLLAQELFSATAEDHADWRFLNEAIDALASTGKRVNADKSKADHFAEVQEFFAQTLSGGEKFEYLKTVLLHPSQQNSDRKVLMVLKVVRYHMGNMEKMRLILMSDVLIVCTKKFRQDKLVVSDFLWLCEAGAVSLISHKNEDCLLIESRMAEKKLLAEDDAKEKQHFFSFQFSVSVSVGDDDLMEMASVDRLEKIRMEINNRIAICTGTSVPVVHGVEMPHYGMSSGSSSIKNARMSTRVKSHRDSSNSILSRRLSGSKFEEQKSSNEDLSASIDQDNLSLSDSMSRLEKMTGGGSGSGSSGNMIDGGGGGGGGAGNAGSGNNNNNNGSGGIDAPMDDNRTVLMSPQIAPKRDRGPSFMGRMNKTFRKKDAKVKMFGTSITAVFDQCNQQVPPIVSDCVLELTEKGLKTEGLFRVPGSGEQVQKLKVRYDAFEHVDLSNVDAHTIASLLSLWFRELPESLLPVSLCELLLELVGKKVSDEIFHDLISNQLQKPNLLCLGEMLLLCHEISKHSDVTKMTAENLSVCLTPDFVRDPAGEANPMSSLKVASTYGRLVKYMIEKANTMFSRAEVKPMAEADAAPGSSKAAKKMVPKKGAKKEKAKKGNANNGVPPRPKDLPVMKERGNLGTVFATDASHSAAGDELNFKQGEKITIHQIHHSGWWFGANEKGDVGVFAAAKTNAGGVIMDKQQTMQTIHNTRKMISPIQSPRDESGRASGGGSPPARPVPSKPPKPAEVIHNPSPPRKPHKPKDL